MSNSRFTEARMVAILREADKNPVAEVAKKPAISTQSIYTWRKQFGGMGANEVKRLRQLDVENSRLKKIVAERDLEIDVMKETAAKKSERTRPSTASRLRDEAEPLETASVCADVRGTFGDAF